MTQAGIRPHFVSSATILRTSGIWKTRIRATFGLGGAPIRLTIRQKGDKED